MPPLAKYKYTKLSNKLGNILRDAPRAGRRPREVSPTWLRSGYGINNNEGSIISVLRFVGLIRPDGTPTDLWDTIMSPNSHNKIRFADAVRTAYDDLFEHYEDAHRQDDETLRIFFEGQGVGGMEVQRAVLRTFKTLVAFGDFDTSPKSSAASRIELPELVRSIETLNYNASEWLKSHNKILGRMEELYPIRRRLDALSLEREQSELFQDAILAAEAELHRASHVLAWSGFTGFFYKPFSIDLIKAEHPELDMKKIEGSMKTDYSRIQGGWQLFGFYDRGTEKTLQGLLNDRNRCAHGSGYAPNFNEVFAFLKKLFDMIDHLQSGPGNRW
jgi:hypothetical protein